MVRVVRPDLEVHGPPGGGSRRIKLQGHQLSCCSLPGKLNRLGQQRAGDALNLEGSSIGLHDDGLLDWSNGGVEHEPRRRSLQPRTEFPRHRLGFGVAVRPAEQDFIAMRTRLVRRGDRHDDYTSLRRHAVRFSLVGRTSFKSDGERRVGRHFFRKTARLGILPAGDDAKSLTTRLPDGQDRGGIRQCLNFPGGGKLGSKGEGQSRPALVVGFNDELDSFQARLIPRFEQDGNLGFALRRDELGQRLERGAARRPRSTAAQPDRPIGRILDRELMSKRRTVSQDRAEIILLSGRRCGNDPVASASDDRRQIRLRAAYPRAPRSEKRPCYAGQEPGARSQEPGARSQEPAS